MVERLQEKKGKSKYFMERRNGTWTTLLQVFQMLHKVWDKKRNLKTAETPKIIQKVETGTINRESRKIIIAVPKVEVTIKITHINSQLKMTKTNDAYTSWSYESRKE